MKIFLIISFRQKRDYSKLRLVAGSLSELTFNQILFPETFGLDFCSSNLHLQKLLKHDQKITRQSLIANLKEIHQGTPNNARGYTEKTPIAIVDAAGYKWVLAAPKQLLTTPEPSQSETSCQNHSARLGTVSFEFGAGAFLQPVVNHNLGIVSKLHRIAVRTAQSTSGDSVRSLRFDERADLLHVEAKGATGSYMNTFRWWLSLA